MHRELLRILCDPVSKGELKLLDERLDECGLIVEGRLASASGDSYPIRAGIPRFVSDAGRKEGVESFGKEWNHFNFVDFKLHWLSHTVKNTFGSADAFKGQQILDAGGGSGAQTLWMLQSGARHVVMLELSDSVDDVVQRNLAPSGFTNYDVIQCSIDAPPLKSHSIAGIVYCHNVIQHTPSVQHTARALFDLVAPGGEFVFNCYPLNDEGPARWFRLHFIYQPLRSILSRMPFSVILVYSRLMGVLRELPGIGMLLEKAGFCVQGEVPRAHGASALVHLKRRFEATALNTFDCFGSHQFQHLTADRDLEALVRSLQPDPAKVLNSHRYFQRPQPIGCALRIRR